MTVSYDSAERTRLMDAAAEVLLATVAADRTGVLAYYREIMAAGRYLYDARRRYAHNELVQQLFSHQDEQNTPGDDGEALTRERLLDRLTEIGQIVRNDDEGREFKQFLYDLARNVARASGNIFTGRVSADEAVFLADLRERLRLPESAS
jgi:hypothetical protein